MISFNNQTDNQNLLESELLCPAGVRWKRPPSCRRPRRAVFDALRSSPAEGMLALAEADPLQDVEMVTCIISRPTGRVTVTLSADTTLSQLHQAVATQANIVPGSRVHRRRWIHTMKPLRPRQSG